MNKIEKWINDKITSIDEWAGAHLVWAMLITCLLSILFFGAIVILMP